MNERGETEGTTGTGETEGRDFRGGERPVDIGSSTGAPGVSGTEAPDFRVEAVDTDTADSSPEDQGPEPAA